MAMEPETPFGARSTTHPPGRADLQTRALAFLQRRAGLVLLFLLAVGTGGVLWHLSHESANLYHTMAVQGAEFQAETLTETRKLYADVVDRLEPHGIKATPDYKAHDGTVPLPATLVRELGERLQRERPGWQVRLYSDWPFPGHKGPRPELDAFEKDALRALREHPDRPFYRFEDYQGQPSLRYAVADRMQAACLRCHNDPASGSPKTDWKEGDVRGVVELVRPLGGEIGRAQAGLNWTLIGTVVAYGVGLLGLGLMARRLQRAQATLLVQHNLLEGLLRYVPDSIYFKDRESRFLRISRSLAERLGLRSPANAVGKTDFDFFSEEHARPAFEDEQAVMRTERPVVGKEEKETWTDGRVRWVSTTKVPLRDGAGRVVGTLGISRDITASKEAEAELRASEQRTRLIVDTAHDAFVAMNAQGAITEWNHQAEIVFGWSRAEAVGRPLAETIIPPQYRERHTRGVQHFLETGEGPVLNKLLELSALRRDGTEFPVELTIAPIRLGEQWFFAAFVRDITRRKRVLAELQQAKEAAESASRAKSEFLANMSHEIRTPMNGILGMTELALDTELTREQRDYLTMVKVSAEGLLGVINDILDFSKIEAQRLQLEAIDFSLRDSLGDTMKALALRAQQKGLELACHVPPDVPDALNGDPGRLRQIIVNLVGNAIKFTERGEVVVSVAMTNDGMTNDERSPKPQARSPNEGEGAAPGFDIRDSSFLRHSSFRDSSFVSLHFEVRDTGIGIPADKQRKIFQAFEQADTSTTRQYGGTGLGLTISARLVEMMGGRIRVESEPGRGSIFHFTARFAPARGPVASPAMARPETLHGLPVLVVDDNATNRLILHEMLTNWRMRPAVVEGAAQALAALEQAAAQGEPFPLVLLDVMMPGVDGFTLAEQIQRHPELTGSVLLMLSSAARAEDSARCRQLGIATYLTKPVKQSELLDAILTARHAATDKEERAAPAAAPVLDRGRLRVLLAEDNVVNQRLAVRLLEKQGHAVVVANNGHEALAALEREPFDLVLMDVQMPDMGGFETTAEIRRREAERGNGRHVPVIAMTAHAMKGDRERCLAAGMDDYVSKPVRAQELFEAIARVLVVGGKRAGDAAPAADAELDRADLLNRLVGGDAELLKEVVGVFLDSCPTMLAELKQAVDRRDASAVQRAAHALKGAVANFGAKTASEAAQRLEVMGRDQDLGRAAEAYAALEMALERLRPALERLAE
jgi:PAS domain S-box-containing protein